MIVKSTDNKQTHCKTHKLKCSGHESTGVLQRLRNLHDISVFAFQFVLYLIVAGKFDKCKEYLRTLPMQLRHRILQQVELEYNLTPFLHLPFTEASAIPTEIYLYLSTDDNTCRDIDGNSILHILIRRGRQDDITTLLDKTRDIRFGWLNGLLDLFNDEGRTPIHSAALYSQVKTVTALKRAGADIDKPSRKSGLTALHYAVVTEDKEMISCLINLNANVTAMTYAGHTPIDMSREKKSTEIMRLFKNNDDEEMEDYTEDEDYL